MFCAKCDSEEIVETGVPSKIDGKHDWICKKCGFQMAPLRNRAWLATLFVICVVLSIAGIFQTFKPEVLLGEADVQVSPIRSRLLGICPFLAFTIGAFVTRKELTLPQPKTKL